MTDLDDLQNDFIMRDSWLQALLVGNGGDLTLYLGQDETLQCLATLQDRTYAFVSHLQM